MRELLLALRGGKCCIQPTRSVPWFWLTRTGRNGVSHGRRGRIILATISVTSLRREPNLRIDESLERFRTALEASILSTRYLGGTSAFNVAPAYLRKKRGDEGFPCEAVVKTSCAGN
jgi:hypothetical protein